MFVGINTVTVIPPPPHPGGLGLNPKVSNPADCRCHFKLLMLPLVTKPFIKVNAISALTNNLGQSTDFWEGVEKKTKECCTILKSDAKLVSKVNLQF